MPKQKGVDTLYRITTTNHITLGDIADKKADTILAVNAIIVSIALSVLFPKLDNPSNNYLISPTIVLLIGSVISMILSIAVIKPHITTGKFSKNDVVQRKVNLIFFGNFYKMQLQEI